MNCFEFRRLYIADPGSADPEYRRHRETCETCAAFLERQDGFDRTLRAALEIDVPASLDARLILRQTTRRTHTYKKALAYAASVLVTLGIAGGAMWWPRAQSIDELVIAHIVSEPEHMMSHDVVSANDAREVLRRIGMSLTGDLGVIRFAETCPGRPGVHLVLAGSRGPVTVLILPANAVKDRQAIAHGGLAGVIVPAAGGSVAIVGLAGESLQHYEQRLRAAITELT